MAYSSTNPVSLVTQGIAGLRIWDYQTTEGSTVVLTSTGYFTDGVARGMKLGDLIVARGTSAGSSQTMAIGIVSSVNTTAGTVGGALASILISTA
jgi:S1-C subfamily serine protease